ncbi:hypothetical protein IJT10_04620, partial [bacterium]|nr:hypothetical protein [bacterium]
QALIGAVYLDDGIVDGLLVARGLLTARKIVFEFLNIKETIEKFLKGIAISDDLKEVSSFDEGTDIESVVDNTSSSVGKLVPEQKDVASVKDGVAVTTTGTVLRSIKGSYDSAKGSVVSFSGMDNSSEQVTASDKEDDVGRELSSIDDPKSLLQQIVHVCYKKDPQYKQESIEQRVKVSVCWSGKDKIIGEGKTKKEAEFDAACKALCDDSLQELLREKDTVKSKDLLNRLEKSTVVSRGNSGSASIEGKLTAAVPPLGLVGATSATCVASVASPSFWTKVASGVAAVGTLGAAGVAALTPLLGATSVVAASALPGICSFLADADDSSDDLDI